MVIGHMYYVLKSLIFFDSVNTFLLFYYWHNFDIKNKNQKNYLKKELLRYLCIYLFSHVLVTALVDVKDSEQKLELIKICCSY